MIPIILESTSNHLTSSNRRIYPTLGACVILALCGVSGVCAAQNQPTSPPKTSSPASTPAAEPAPVPTPAEIEPKPAVFDPALPALLEIKLAKTGHLLVRPSVNGHAPGWFIFDTGAGICVISKPHIDLFQLDSSGSIQAVGVGGASNQSLYKAKTLTLGPAKLTDHPIMTADLTFLKQFMGEEIYGIIGYGLLSSVIAEVDLSTPAISLHDPAIFTLPPERGSWQELILEARIPCVRARCETHEGLFRLDTGADGHVTIHEPTIKKWNMLEGREVKDAKLGGVGGFVAAKSGTLSTFHLGNVDHHEVPAMFALEAKGSFADAAKDGNIGTALLKHYVLILDYTQRRIAFIHKKSQ